MDGSRFDAWTRRNFGLALGGAAATALGLALLDETSANNNKKKKKRCKKGLQQGCQPGNKNNCCKKGQGLACGEILGQDGKRCCRKPQGPCEDAADCCDGFVCDQIDGLGEQTRCCSANGGPCGEEQDCCTGFACDENIGECVS